MLSPSHLLEIRYKLPCLSVNSNNNWWQTQQTSLRTSLQGAATWPDEFNDMMPEPLVAMTTSAAFARMLLSYKKSTIPALHHSKQRQNLSIYHINWPSPSVTESDKKVTTLCLNKTRQLWFRQARTNSIFFGKLHQHTDNYACSTVLVPSLLCTLFALKICDGNDANHNVYSSVDCWWLWQEPVL